MRKMSIMVVALLATLALVAPTSVARAEPRAAAAAPTHRLKVTNKNTVSKIKRAVQTARNNNGGSRWLNYRTAIKRFGPHTKARRYFAAGWMLRRPVYKMSAKERRIVTRIRNKWRNRSMVAKAAPNCRGRQGQAFRAGWTFQYWLYMNSCATNVLIAEAVTCAAAMGWIANYVPDGRVKAAVGFFTVVCTGAGAWITAARANSSLNAIILVHRLVWLPVGWKVVVQVRPQ